MNKLKMDLKYREGITLISLVVTIIILLILAGISIASLIGNGLFEKAKLAKEKQENAQKIEDSILKEYEEKIQGTRNTIFEESKIISDFKIITKSIYANEIIIDLSEDALIENVIGYIVFIGDNAIDLTKSMPYEIIDLKKDTEYKDIYIIAIDNKGNIKQSDNKLNVKTKKLLVNGMVAYWPLKNNLQNIVEDDIFGDFVIEGNVTNASYEESGGIILNDNCFLRSEKSENSLPDEFTFSIDVKINSDSPWAAIWFISKGTISEVNANGIYLWESYQRWASVSGKNTSTPQYEACSFNKWERLVITGSKSKQKYLTYLNGNLLNTNNGYEPVKGFLGIGHAYPKENDTHGNLKGTVKNIAIYDKVFTEDEIKNIAFDNLYQ